MTSPITDLLDQTTGSFLIRTRTGSEYVVDLDNHTMLRKPDLTVTDAVSMRRDADPVLLLAIAYAAVGHSGYFLVDLNVKDVAATTRITSPIVSIELIPEDTTALDAALTDLLDRYPNTLRRLGE